MTNTSKSEPLLSLVLVTYPVDNDYRAWCKSIIERKLAACVNIVKVDSIYRFKGKIEESEEVLLIFKTKRETAKLLKEVIMKEHPYEVPEFLELQITDVNEPYLNWVLDSVLTSMT